MSTSSIQVYACGGAATNIIAPLLDTPVNRELFADTKYAFVDMSRSNFRDKNIPEELIYLVPNVDGSGGVRGTNLTRADGNVSSVLKKFKPSRNLNIVISSLHGGSGATMALLLIRELINEGAPFVVIGIGGYDSLLRIKNSISAMVNFDKIAVKYNTPVIMTLIDNGFDDRRAEVNDEVLDAVARLAWLQNGTHVGYDSADLRHFLEYNKVTKSPPRLTLLHTFLSVPEIKEFTDAPIAICSLSQSGTSVGQLMPDYLVQLDIHPDYANPDLTELHFVLDPYSAHNALNQLKDRHELAAKSAERTLPPTFNSDLLDDDSAVV